MSSSSSRAFAATALALLLTVPILAACGSGSGSGSASAVIAGSSPAGGASASGSASAASVLALAASAYTVAQNASSVTVTVNRTGDVQAAASVTYGTVFGTALDGINYGNTYGVLNWASGDAVSKTITIPILNAAAFSGTRALTLTLSKPAGASLGTPATATVTIEGEASTQAAAAVKMSISNWVSCTGTTDDTAGLRTALAAARHAAFTLVVDCPVTLKIGMDIARPIFIDDGTTVEFGAAGRLTIDNVFIPAFVIANSTDVILSGWNIEYDASLPVNPKVNGYEESGKFVSNAATQPGNAFNDMSLTSWLTANRGLVFDASHGLVRSSWSGGTNMCAVFLISGDSSNVRVTDMHISVPAGAGGDRFVPVVFALDANYKSRQSVTTQTPLTGQYFAIPHDLTFSNVVLDGTYMGWVGNARNAAFSNIQSHRYGDLQDAKGDQVGGVEKWFSPPHLFYLGSSATTDAALMNSNIQITNVVDDGPRIGVARDKGGGDSISGYALSLKISCVTCTVDSYRSSRPDGFLDVLASNGLTISNVTATYDSSFLNHLYPGWRFPSAPYKNMLFKNIVLTDSAASSIQQPIGDAGQDSNEGLVLSNVQVQIVRWAGPAVLPLPTIAGQGNDISLRYSITAENARIVRSQTDSVTATLGASPYSMHPGGVTNLTWSSRGATGCSASGDWSGSLPTGGSRHETLAAVKAYEFAFACENTANASNASLPVVVAD